jgi:hexosaminidase
MALVSEHLNYYGLRHNSSYPAMLSRMTGEDDPMALQVFGDVMQPPRGYARGELGHYDAFTPLNRMVDAVPPESETARKFSLIVNRIVVGEASVADWDEAKKWLLLWSSNDAYLQPLLPKSQLTQELAPVSANLRQVSQTGLDAIGYLREHRIPPPGWKTRQLAFLKISEKPQAVLLNMVAPAVANLVQATANSPTARH